jgi:hypothetical protein
MCFRISVSADLYLISNPLQDLMSVYLHNIIFHTVTHYQYLNRTESHAELKPRVADCGGSSV